MSGVGVDTLCGCVLAEAEGQARFTFFEDIGRAVDDRINATREFLRDISRLGFS